MIASLRDRRRAEVSRRAASGAIRLSTGLLALFLVLSPTLLTGCRTPGARPVAPAIDSRVRFSARIPDVADYAAAELASAALVSDRSRANRLLRRLRAIDTVLVTGGDLPTGLVPVATDLVNATVDAPRVYLNATRALLKSADLDPALRERLVRAERDDVLELAEERIRDARMIAFARVFNAFAEPLGRSIVTTTMAPFRLARSLLSYALEVYSDDALPLQRRQALAHWKEFVARYPDAPETELLRTQIEWADGRLNETRRDRTMFAAERAFEVGQTRLALVYADRALRLVPEDAKAATLRDKAETRLLEERESRRWSLEAASEMATPLPAAVRLGTALFDPNADLARAADDFLAADPDGELADEARFLRAVALGEAGLEDEKWDALEDLADAGAANSNMARHAAALVRDPGANPYRAFRAARSVNRKHEALWVLFGPFARGVPERGLPRPVEWAVGLPSIAQAVMSSPIRLIQLPWLDALPAARLAAVYAHRYLELYPAGEKAAPVRRWLLSHEKKRKNWIAMHRIAGADPEPNGEDLAELREKAAEQALEYASREKRRNLRNTMYRHVAREYANTAAGQRAGEAARAELEEVTPQHIQITRGFLLENPEFAGPRGVGLGPHLLDDDAANGELHPNGVTLIGGRTIALDFVGPSGDEDDPPTRVHQKISAARLARIVAKLEETSFRNELIDSDEDLSSDAHRDVFFERARLGLADQIDRRPLAGSSYSYRGMRERYGMVRARESILPFDLVIQGSLTDLSLGAFPRVRKPRETPDAFLYR